MLWVLPKVWARQSGIVHKRILFLLCALCFFRKNPKVEPRHRKATRMKSFWKRSDYLSVRYLRRSMFISDPATVQIPPLPPSPASQPMHGALYLTAIKVNVLMSEIWWRVIRYRSAGSVDQVCVGWRGGSQKICSYTSCVSPLITAMQNRNAKQTNGMCSLVVWVFTYPLVVICSASLLW